MVHRFLRTLVFAILIAAPLAVSAQNQTQPATSSSDGLLKAEELDALVAPIALYPDTLLSLVLMASTYPLEVVQADRWVKENTKLKGEKLKIAVDAQAWDDSIKSLAATPDVLAMMSNKLDWTQKLGNAVLAQQPDVMDAVQRLRTRADANKKLASNKQQTVTKSRDGAKQIIAIEPTDPDTVYVPYYDPSVVYGGWPYPAYPPYYFGYPGYIGSGLIRAGLAFGAGWALGNWGSSGNYWGGGVNWNNNNINIDRPRPRPPTAGGPRPSHPIAGEGNRWQHKPEHRQGVRYNNSSVRQKYGNANIRDGSQARMDFRGRTGNEVLRPGGSGAQRPGAGAGESPSRPSAGQRPSRGKPGAGGRPSSRPSAGQRPSGGGRGGNALGNISSGKAARAQAARGHASLASRGGGGARAGGGGSRGGGGARAGGGGGRGGGGGGGGRGGGGRRSDIALKHDIVLLGHLANGIGFYRFSYNGSNKAYVGVMAQDVQGIEPDAVTRGRDGYLRVFYDKVGVRFETYRQWIADGSMLPSGISVSH